MKPAAAIRRRILLCGALPPWVAGGLLVNLATLTWATNMILGRWLRESIGPFTLSALRFALAVLCFGVLLRAQPPAERWPGRDLPLLLAMAIAGVALFAPILYGGLRETTAVNATLISGLGPLITGLMAALLIREPFSVRQRIAALLGLIGVAVVISGGSPALWRSLRGQRGDLLVLAALTLWGLYSVLGRRVMARRSALSATALSMAFALPPLIPAALIEQRFLPLRGHPEMALAVLYIGIVPTVLGFLAWNAGVRRLGPGGAMMFYNTLPLYGALLGHFLLGEPLGPTHLIGGALILGAGLWAAAPCSERSSKPDYAS
ncbi:MAG: DMT family transporter [Thermoflexus sp.]|jgi:drug/metabolite transporter (DMT)-like permease|nr:DMT family transporter [Thermoflexus sp.]